MPRRKGSKNEGVFCLKGKKLEGEQLKKLLKNNAIMHERYANDPAYRAKFFIDEICLNCGKVNRKYKNSANGFCNSKCRWQYIKKTDPLKWKARSLSANLLFGIGKGNKGKLEFIENLIKEAVGNRCKYCGAELTLKNINIDHKTPFGKIEYRRHKVNSVEVRLALDAKTNIHIICAKCNRIKRDMTDEEYQKLLEFLDTDKSLKDKILKRLGAGQVWAYKN